jgi:AraC family transcriptional regulator
MEMQAKQPTAAGRYEPWPHRGVWEYACPGKMLLSSADRGWSGLSAELCTARRGVIPWRTPPSDIRICIAVRSSEAIVTRLAPGIESQIIAREGTLWLSPAGMQDGSVDFAEELPEFMHMYLPLSHFSSGNFDTDTDVTAVGALRYETALEDPLLAEIGCAVVSELKTETSAGSILVESLANTIAARLVQKHAGTSPARSYPLLKTEGLDRRRLLRVLDYIEANLEGDLSIDRMASIACLSRYHFARAFKQAVGQPPHRHVSARRLERAKALLTRGDRPLVDIALALGFSDQANFTRAFRQATGHAPGQFRQAAGSRRSEFSLTDVRRSLPVLA